MKRPGLAEAGPVRSREHLLHMLAEASELEHNLLCSDLSAAFSLKRHTDEGLEPNELEAARKWRGQNMDVCMEEMTHLAQVANLMVAVGSQPHFDRPNLLPNGNPQPGPKFDDKMAGFERLLAHAAELAASGHPVLLAGDYNVVPTDADIYDPRSWQKNALLQPEPQRAWTRLLAAGWSDAQGELHPGERTWTFWDVMRNGWARDAGMRIDHLPLSRSLRPRRVAAGVDRAVRGLPGSSDHAPAWIELSDAPAA